MTKYDKDTGATFALKQNGHKILSKTTDANGIVTFSGLDTTGSYTVEETNPPVGYQPATGEQKVTFDAQMKTGGGSHEVTTSLVFYKTNCNIKCTTQNK
ncbi:prealbumin-like fold domain-containing protein [Kurthia populi]|uniref:Prealbumin-like fold domain-containing protein n=1 Tax=Kurthia populi TaxID=1562132 RepID=A0ABW5Y2B7_9BACL